MSRIRLPLPLRSLQVRTIVFGANSFLEVIRAQPSEALSYVNTHCDPTYKLILKPIIQGDLNCAFTALQQYIVPNSCPKPLSDIPLKAFGKLEVVTNSEARNMSLEFEAANLWIQHVLKLPISQD